VIGFDSEIAERNVSRLRAASYEAAMLARANELLTPSEALLGAGVPTTFLGPRQATIIDARVAAKPSHSLQLLTTIAVSSVSVTTRPNMRTNNARGPPWKTRLPSFPARSDFVPSLQEERCRSCNG
jgi:hypothetical protein